MSDSNRKPESDESDPAKLARLLEIELMQKRAGWQQAKARRGNYRALSFFFLFIVIAGALVGFYVFLSPERVHELKEDRAGLMEPGASPTASPE
ncbi:MAG TPA: hypothetical protein VF551_04025 [Chthoniobacterales bacterium]